MEKKETIDAENSSKSGITQHQLSKFQELQRRRLKLTSKAKNKKFKTKGAKTKPWSKELDTKELVDDENSDQCVNDPCDTTSSSSQGCESNEILSASLKVDVHPAFQKKKLHWGLDSKERWERKANM
ncbi:hypothetical protein RND81_08G222500 [Saponaria officinalis]|uniref:Uncharacterized protein n=1 Tax=Saponaria officinalis TaxID=3572 RepID=A0AAW1JAM6_SAPOF